MKKIKITSVLFSSTLTLMVLAVGLPMFVYASPNHGEHQDTNDEKRYRVGNKSPQYGLINGVVKHFKEYHFAYKPKEDECLEDINKALLNTANARIASLYDLLSQETKNRIFKEFFATNSTIAECDQNDIFYHLLSSYQFYVKSDLTDSDYAKDKIIDYFFDTELYELVQNVIEERSYISFVNRNEQDLTKTASHIVITAKDMRDSVSQLEQILNQNAEHTLFVKIDESLVNRNGYLSMIGHPYPRNLKHVVLSDTNHSVKRLASYFFNRAVSLLSISMIGFRNLTEIEESFLLNCGLTLFSCEGLKSVKSIEDSFLTGNEIISFSSKGLENLTSIGGFFLGFNSQLRSVDLTALKNVNFVGKRCFFMSPKIEEIFVTRDKEAFFRQYIPQDLQDKIIVIDDE